MRSETLRFKTSDLANILMVDARYHSRLPVAIPGFCNFEQVNLPTWTSLGLLGICPWGGTGNRLGWVDSLAQGYWCILEGINPFFEVFPRPGIDRRHMQHELCAIRHAGCARNPGALGALERGD
jgi:hypothetical protein